MSRFFQRFFQQSFRRPFDGQKPLSYFGNKIRIYKANGSILKDPTLLWDGGQGIGLKYFLSDFKDGTMPSTEIMIFISKETAAALPDLNPWYKQCLQTIGTPYLEWITSQKIRPYFSGKNVGISFWPDEKYNLKLGLEAQEFALGFLDNRHRKGKDSKPLVTIDAHISSQSDDFQSLGALHNDQIAWTLGNHPLDSFKTPAVPFPAALIIQQNARGEVNYSVNPNVPGLSLREANKENQYALFYGQKPLVTLLLKTLEFNRLTIHKSLQVDAATQTIQLNVNDFHLQPCGHLFQKVHFSQWMKGYRTYLHRGYHFSSRKEKAIGVFRVEGTDIFFESFRPPCFVNGKILSSQKELLLEAGMEINCSGLRLTFHKHGLINNRNWPYIGAVHFSNKPKILDYGFKYTFGRSANCDIPLANEATADNIDWLPAFANTAQLPQKNGSIPKTSFSTDAVMVALEHALLNLKSDPSLMSLSNRCPSFVRRKKKIFPLNKAGLKHPLLAMDELLIGNDIYELQFHKTPIWYEAQALLQSVPTYVKLTSK
ncbi:MAG: hypothetical protein VX278_19825 [Myxococcota bacterium]|nr:hypothetical protein [Myxococcota bacterium]